MRVSIILLLVLFLFLPSVFAIGISPAIKKITFLPDTQVNISYSVLDTTGDRLYDIGFRGGDFVKYSLLSTSVVQGEGGFVLIINFPHDVPEPGKHTISVSVKERQNEESFIGTVIEVGSIVEFFVPYPGQYGELALNIPDSNVGDNLPVELHVINRGFEELNLSNVTVNFYSDSQELVSTLNFTSVTLPYSGDRYFRKYFNTSNLLPGNYIAVGSVNYGDTIKTINSTFKLGSLYVNLTNYTRSLPTGGINKFIFYLSSKWNAPLSNVFVDVSLSNGIGNNKTFRTPSIVLSPWQSESLESYLDTNDMLGQYNASINVSYNGGSSFFTGLILITAPPFYKRLFFIIGAILFVVILVTVIIWIAMRRRPKRSR